MRGAHVPSPLAGEGGSRRLTDEGSHRRLEGPDRAMIFDVNVTPHPTSLRSATFSRKGRRTRRCAP